MSEPRAITVVRRLIEDAIERRVFPGAVAEVGSSRGPLWREPFGLLTFGETAQPIGADTIFDLASLTKPIATTSVVMRLVDANMLRLSDTLDLFFPEWKGPQRAGTTLQDLLEHAAGLAARLVDPPPDSRREFEHEICSMPLEVPPRTRAIYSDLGFLLLGFLAEDRAGAALDLQFRAVLARLLDALGLRQDLELLSFAVPRDLLPRTAPTEPLSDDHRRGRLLRAEVHDPYAARLGGVAGHAGLFGTAEGVGVFARGMLCGARGDSTLPAPFTPSLVGRTIRRSHVPGSSRALGWDTALSTSSCGEAMSAGAFGHVGFTGTSLWIDPARDRYYVLLTNRACGGGTSDEMQFVRRCFHDDMVRL